MTTEKPAADYTNDAQQRALAMLRILAGNEFTGLLPSEIAKALDISAAMVTRDLFNLEKAGYAETMPTTGRWRLGPRLVQIATAFSAHLTSMRRNLEDLDQRYTRTPS